MGDEVLWIFTSAIIFLVLVATIVILFIIKSREKIFQKGLEKKELEIKFQKQLVSAILEAQENERKQIAQDLHDDISSKLMVLSLNFHLLKLDGELSENKKSIINTMVHTNGQAMESSRKIAHRLFPPILEEFGLDAALSELADDFNHTKQVAISYSNSISFGALPKLGQLHLFRIVQELINNSIKHGQATEINICFGYGNGSSGNTARCRYTDNGIGLNDQLIHKGLGFHNIEDRINSLNGTYTLESEIGQGIAFQFSFKVEC